MINLKTESYLNKKRKNFHILMEIPLDDFLTLLYQKS